VTAWQQWHSHGQKSLRVTMLSDDAVLVCVMHMSGEAALSDCAVLVPCVCCPQVCGRT